MENYRRSSHSVYDIKYHIVWIKKYRKPVLRGEIAERARGYFVASSGNVTDEVIIKYIEEQGKEPLDENFNVSDDAL